MMKFKEILNFTLNFFFCTKKKKNINPLLRGKITNKNFRENLHIKWSAGLPLVQVRIANEEFTFLFDTGALSVIPSDLVKKLNLELLKDGITVLDSAGTYSLQRLYKLESLYIGSLEFQNFTVASDDFTKMFPLSHIGFSGIIGYNFFKDIIVELHYDKDTIVLTDILKKDRSFVKTHLHFDGSSGPEFQIDFTSKSEYVAIDTGKNDGLLLAKPFMKEFFMQNNCQYTLTKGVLSSTFQGENKNEEKYTFIVKNFKIANKLQIQQYPIDVDDSGHALVGNEFLNYFTLIINFKTKVLYIKQIESKMIKKGLQISFGLSFYWTQEKKLYISSLVESGLADVMGLKIGDRVLSLNEIQTLQITEKEYAEEFFLKEYKDSYASKELLHLVIQRDSLIKKVLLNKETIIKK